MLSIEIDQDTQCRSFGALLDKCCRVEPTDEVLVIFDESLNPFLDALIKVIEDRNLIATFSFIPKRYQLSLLRRFSRENENGQIPLPSGVVSALFNSSAILNLLDGDQATVGIRRAVLQQARPANSRFAHIPGVSAEVLNIIAGSPIETIETNCEMLAWALGEARAAILETYDHQGHQHTLHLDLGAWDYEPLISSGIINPGTWGNVPPGESFCCPPADSVTGTICINGSVPEVALTEQESVLLHFDKGQLVGWEGSQQSRAFQFFEDRKRKAEQEGDIHWCTFAELGIGLNPAITTLTGNSLFDEKALGTVHVAIGDNTGFGFSVHSNIHADLVTRNPTLTLDDTPIMERGELRLDRIAEWRDKLPWMRDKLFSTGEVYARKGRFAFRHDRFFRRLQSGHRVGYVMVAEGAMARDLDCLTAEFLGFERVPIVHVLQSFQSPNGSEASDLLRILLHYRIITRR